MTRENPSDALLPLSFLLTSTLFFSCASAEAPPEPIDSESSGLAVSLEMLMGIGPVRSAGTKPETVLFVRLDPGETVAHLADEVVLIPSTFVRGDYAYLLNAPPGRYALVAAIYVEDVGPTEVPFSVPVNSDVSVGYELELSDGKVTHRNYLSRDMIEESLTTVVAGSFAFMGSFEADQPFLFGDADELQLHFMRVLEGEDVDRSGFFRDMQNEGRAHCLTLRTAKRDAETEAAFRREAKDVLEATAWIQRIDGRVPER